MFCIKVNEWSNTFALFQLLCPKCNAKLGSFNWYGEQCSCGRWITPAFQIHKNRVDEMKMLPVLGSQTRKIWTCDIWQLGKKLAYDMCYPCLLSFIADCPVFRPRFHLQYEKIKSLDVTWELCFVSCLCYVNRILCMEITTF